MTGAPPLGDIGGGAAVMLLAIYVGRLVLAWKKEHREGKADDATRPIVNAVSVNEAVVNSAKFLEGRNQHLNADIERTSKRLEKVEIRYASEKRAREKLERRVDEIDREIGHIKRRFALAVTYIRSLLAFINAHDLTDKAPKPPAGLNLDDDRE